MGLIFGIGTDILEISRFEKINIERLSKRILTSLELYEFEKSKNQRLFLAKKFSIKESVAKAFGVGIGERLSFLDIEISKNSEGKPLCYVNNGRDIAITRSKIAIHIASSDTKLLISTSCIVQMI
jgi:holo-[acyl-carrier protein] synthase